MGRSLGTAWNSATFQEYVEIDNGISANQELTEGSIVESILTAKCKEEKKTMVKN